MSWSSTQMLNSNNVKPATAWDYVVLDGIPQPGVWTCKVKGDNGVDVQKAKGGKGARIKDEGQAPLDISLTVELHPEELAQFAAQTLPVIRPKPSKAGQPVVYLEHPNAQLFGVDLVKCKSFDSPMPTSGGTLIISIQCVQYKDPTGVTPAGPPQVPIEPLIGEPLHARVTEESGYGNEIDPAEPLNTIDQPETPLSGGG